MSALEYGERVLAETERHPDAPSADTRYLRALLVIAVAQEKRDLASDFEFTEAPSARSSDS